MGLLAKPDFAPGGAGWLADLNELIKFLGVWYHINQAMEDYIINFQLTRILRLNLILNISKQNMFKYLNIINLKILKNHVFIFRFETGFFFFLTSEF